MPVKTFKYILVLIWLGLFFPEPGHAGGNEASICYGTTSNGRLEKGVALPENGSNFESYSSLAKSLGRTYVHSRVRDVIVETYQQLALSHPDKLYKYAETGFKDGGEFKPHKTHQNGLSVDFIVPVLNPQGKSVFLPTNILNKWGYGIEFDQTGRYEDFHIDFESMAAHLVTLHKVAKKHGLKIWRALFDPGLQPYLYQTTQGRYIKQHILIPNKRSWVRHDDHYHVDFSLDCRPL